MKTCAALAAAAAMLFPGLALGEPFIGASLGSADLGAHARTVALLDPGGRIDERDTGFKLYGGYAISPRFGVEAAYVNLGKASYSGTSFGAEVRNGKVELWGLNLALFGTLPVHERLSLLGKAGLFLAETEVSEIADGNAFSDDFKNWDPSLGIGVRFELRPGLGLRAEWERFELDPGSATLLSVGVDLRF